MSRWMLALPLAFLASPVSAAEPKLDAKGVEFFETKIRPVLVQQCYECHSASSAKLKGGLRLDTRAGIVAGGDSGEVVVPGKPEASLLIEVMKDSGDQQMPPAPKSKLPAHVVADFEKWITMGAPDPRTDTGGGFKRLGLEESKSFWSFKPLAKPAVPQADAGWARTDIDRFVRAKLDEQKLTPAGNADRATLARRLYFDIIGLPPSPEQLAEFVSDKSPDAVEKLTDRLLASPQFGERWGRYWLDLARYAESNGNVDNLPFPSAWRFRDYVIASVNADKPYDQFIREQVAGDLLPAKDDKHKDEMLTATGFLALTSKPRAQNNPDYRMDLIADQIDVTSRAVLGLSVLCARCHDHKFDPISTKEYYGLAGFFDSSEMLFASQPARGNAGKKAPKGGAVKLSSGGEAMGVREGKPTDTAICVRGETTKRGDVVPRGFLTVAAYVDEPKINRSQSGRLELATWLTDPKNPLTARVAVNRIWLHLFGQGLVKSADNFGFLGERPSHPELLDHLASRFIAGGWSTKSLIREIVRSRAYQLSSEYNAANAKTDPDNVYLWRKNIRRLDAEAMRDAVLTASGRLDLTPPTGTLMTEAPTRQKPVVVYKDNNHRSVYQPILRGTPLPESLAMFDAASPNLVVAQREETTVPAQALFLLNGNFVIDQSKSAAKRLLADASMDDSARVDLAYRIMLSRPATSAETARGTEYIRQAATDLKNTEEAWATFCQAIIASAEFRYVR